MVIKNKTKEIISDIFISIKRLEDFESEFNKDYILSNIIEEDMFKEFIKLNFIIDKEKYSQRDIDTIIAIKRHFYYENNQLKYDKKVINLISEYISISESISDKEYNFLLNFSNEKKDILEENEIIDLYIYMYELALVVKPYISNRHTLKTIKRF